MGPYIVRNYLLTFSIGPSSGYVMGIAVYEDATGESVSWASADSASGEMSGSIGINFLYLF